MSEIVDGIDDSALKAAQEALGTTGSRDTVNAALREVARRKILDSFVARMSAQDPAELEKLREAAWQ